MEVNSMANNLRRIRTDLGISQTELAEKSGVSRQTIIKIESDSSTPVKTSTLVKIAEVLKRPVADIFFS
jgi:putative transcriptional regulator